MLISQTNGIPAILNAIIIYYKHAVNKNGHLMMAIFISFTSFYDYLVIFSSLFIIEKINTADTKQQATKINHNCHRSNFPQKLLPIKSSLFPTAVASNHPPCMSPWNLPGATLDTKDKPIGLRNNSAMVRIR